MSHLLTPTAHIKITPRPYSFLYYYLSLTATGLNNLFQLKPLIAVRNTVQYVTFCRTYPSCTAATVVEPPPLQGDENSRLFIYIQMPPNHKVMESTVKTHQSTTREVARPVAKDVKTCQKLLYYTLNSSYICKYNIL